MYRHGGAQLNHLMYVSSVGKRVGNSVEPRAPNNFGGSRQHGVQDSVENRLTRQMRFYLQKEVAGKSDPPRNRTENLLIKSQLLCLIELAGHERARR